MSDKIYMAKSRIPGAGYGVYARRNLKEGELLETCPFIEVPHRTIYDKGRNLLQSYAFQSQRPGFVIVVFGLGSMYNHSTDPNVYYAMNDDDPDRLMDFVVAKDTPKNHELHINYGRGRCSANNPC